MFYGLGEHLRAFFMIAVTMKRCLGMEEVKGNKRVWGLLGPRPLEHRKNTPFQNRICLVLIIAIYMEKEKLVLQVGFTEFCRLRHCLYDLTLQN